METTDNELEMLEKKHRLLQRKLLATNQLNLIENEAMYLMKGHATELIDKVWIPNRHISSSYAKIYGVIGKDNSNGRYLWIYLYFDENLYKCYDLKKAFELSEKLKEFNELEMKIFKLNKKNTIKQKLLHMSSN